MLPMSQPVATHPQTSTLEKATVSRRAVLGAALGLAGASLGVRPARAQTRVKIGYLPVQNCGPLYVAEDFGYLRDAGLDVEWVRFTAGAEMVAPLGTGELTAGYGSSSPGLFSGWTRGVNTMLVADGGRLVPGYGSALTVVRSDLVDQIRTGADLRGRQVGMSIVGSLYDYIMRNFLDQNALTMDDVEVVRIPSADVNAGLAGRRLDVAGVGEPYGALAEQSGIARRWITGDQIVPDMQVAGLFVSERAIRDRPLITALVTAYLRGIRAYGPSQSTNPAIVESVNRWTGVSPEAIRGSVPNYFDPNGGLNVEDLRRQQEFWLRNGMLASAASIDAQIDLSFVEAALQQIGRV
jgi:NitT/TauT family transport system substrate-binding protein